MTGDEPEDISPIPIAWKLRTEKKREHMKARIRRWKKRDLWNLREARDCWRTLKID